MKRARNHIGVMDKAEDTNEPFFCICNSQERLLDSKCPQRILKVQVHVWLFFVRTAAFRIITNNSNIGDSCIFIRLVGEKWMSIILTAKQIDEYLIRIGYRDEISNNLKTLRTLHTCHTMHVPFENLDVILGRPISLKIEDIHRKIVTDSRGGYCFELNALFGSLLTGLGFKVCNYMGRVYQDTNFGGRLHHNMLVWAEGKQWVVDVGFGGNGLIEPLLFEKNHKKSQFADLFRLISEDDRFYILQHWHLDTWHNIYGFSLEPSTQQDYFVGSYYCSTCPSSAFTKKLIITKPTPTGRVSLVNNQFSIRKNSKTTLQKNIVSTEEFRKVLAEYFGIATERIELLGENWFLKK